MDTLYDEDLDLMVKAGCDGVFFGVETGSARMQKVIRKEIDLKEYDSLMTNCLNRGLRVNSGFILGFPEEKDGDMLETIQYVLKSKFQGVAHPSLNRLKALAGTELHKRHRSELRHLCRDEFSDVEDDLCLDLVRKHPDLFSSYYLVPHSDFSDQDLEDFISFCQSLTQNYYVMLNWILEKSVLGLRDLFDLWKNWPGKDSRTPTTEKVFGRFVTETVLPVIARSRLSQNASFMDGTASKFTASTI